MSLITNATVAATLGLMMTGFATAQQDMTWDASKPQQVLYYAYKDPACNLQVDKAWHPGKDQPIHISVYNNTHAAAQYRLALTVVKGKESLGSGYAQTEAKNGDKSELLTAPFKGSLAGSQIMVQVVGCTIRR